MREDSISLLMRTGISAKIRNLLAQIGPNITAQVSELSAVFFRPYVGKSLGSFLDDSEALREMRRIRAGQIWFVTGRAFPVAAVALPPVRVII